MGNVFRIITLLFIASVFGLAVSAQDLGSSNTLFGGKKPAAAPVKRPSAKPKAASKTKKRTPKPATAKKSSPAKPTTAKPADSKTTSATVPIRTAKDEPVIKIGTPVKNIPAAVEKKPAVVAKEPVRIDPKVNELFEKLIRDGNDARDDRDYAAAEAAYLRARTTKSSDGRAAFGLGNLYTDQQRWEDAEKAYRSVLELEPANAAVRIALSYVLTQPVAAPNLSERYDEAEKLARKAIELDPNSAIAHDQFGVALELRGLIGAETESAYRRSIQLAPGFAPAHAHLGRLLRRRGKAAESANAYSTAVERATDIPTMILVADVMQSEQRYTDSEPLLRRAIAGDSRNPSALLLLSRALIAAGAFAEAETMLKRAADISPNGFNAHSMLGMLYARQNRFEAAENALLQASRFISSYDKLALSGQFETVGDGYLKAGNRQAAARVFRKAQAFNPDLETIAAKIKSVSR